jgi:hypothetical protein
MLMLTKDGRLVGVVFEFAGESGSGAWVTARLAPHARAQPPRPFLSAKQQKGDSNVVWDFLVKTVVNHHRGTVTLPHGHIN